ncbi:hypothetical protein NVIE_1567 [Nitrososphaera viennensis EN76]|uniref:Uncharacterized protein n=1 Tax=Nitrososphaera viennensis EN76 TaxID=926571 RepID=A0A060HQG1_9ARCH|nr:hypothetical protein NVIE_1567 [Nitrososphaera viennensis EN76]
MTQDGIKKKSLSSNYPAINDNKIAS